MEVEETGLRGGARVEAVDDVRGNGDVRAGSRLHRLELRADAEGQLALEHVEGVRVLPVDVRLGAALAGPEARPGDVEVLVREEDEDVVLRPGVHDLSLAGKS